MGERSEEVEDGRDVFLGSSPAPDQDGESETETSVDRHAADAHWAQVEARLRIGANWFYWIAGLSIVNTVILLSDGKIHFVLGLGITQFANAIAVQLGQQRPDLIDTFRIIAGAFTLVVTAVFAGFGYGCKRRLSWLFIVGMVLYTFDGLIYILFQDWFSIAFHVFALTRLFSGFQACRELNGATDDLAAQEA